MENRLYDYWPISERKAIEWPDGARLAFYIGLNIEHFEMGKRSTSLSGETVSLTPDALNHGWRDYGTRVGVWRMMKLLDECGMRASVLLNADVCKYYPEIIEAGNERDWVWLGHGVNNSNFWTGMTVEEEQEAMAQLTETLVAGTGRQPKGWLGPALTETFETPRILAENGFTYLMDWCSDDQPFPLNVEGHRMISVPYSIEVNDIPMFLGSGATPEAFAQMVIDQFDQMREEASGGVMALALHPFLINQPFRHKHLKRALEYIAGHSDVWLTTSDEVADHYHDHYYDDAVEQLSSRRA